jgi:GNAT superfamily N-acetyltransferase
VVDTNPKEFSITVAIDSGTLTHWHSCHSIIGKKEAVRMSTLVPLKPEHISQLYQLYRQQSDALPHNLVPGQERFDTALLEYAAGSSFVIEEAGVAAGYAAIRHVTDDQDTAADAIVALIAANPQAGSELITACLAQLQPGVVLAFPQTHGQCPIPGFNAGWDGLSEQLHETMTLLTSHGFVPYYRELLMACDLNQWPTHAEPHEIIGITIRDGISSEGDFMQRAWVGEERIAMCFYSTLAAQADDPRAATTGYIGWLWTDETQRRRGIGHELLRRALLHLQSLGCTACWLGTGAENWAAQPLYRALGFNTVDVTASFRLIRE